MIETPTVLILGAGASIDFGYPPGKLLYKSIVGELGNPRCKFCQFLREARFSDDEMRQFGESLRYSGLDSVDAFLEHRAEFTKIGKAAIAEVLIRKEATRDLFGDPLNGNWYKYLFQRLDTSFDQFGNNKLGVVTFNYDRSLEQFLCVALQNRHGKGERDCAEQLSRIPIVHVHGVLGGLPWQQNLPYRREYAPEATTRDKRQSADMLKIIHEGTDEDAAFREARELLAGATHIYFLGFGYNPTNIRRLQLHGLPGGHTIRGSTRGLTEDECNDAEQAMSEGMPGNRLHEVRLVPEDWNVLEFLRNVESVH
ncbi:hypothetical protein LCGC14_1619050 [marine sediment metagenome]|uniref:SIR2-like domain-containing protein n=1 Tax=marine sediment metagenome TaxID=412755 RepID=A0A0F9ISY7_9ZZZZ